MLSSNNTGIVSEFFDSIGENGETPPENLLIFKINLSTVPAQVKEQFGVEEMITRVKILTKFLIGKKSG